MMTSTNITETQAAFSEEIKALQAAIALDPTDVLSKISLASQLELEGFPKAAATVYQDIIATDTEGVFAARAKQALLALDPEIAALDNGSTQVNPEVLGVWDTGGAQYTPEILEFKQAIANDPTDMVAQISLASALESEGLLQEAAETYRYIIDNDQDGVFSGSAAQALGGLQDRLEPLPLISKEENVAQTVVAPEDFDYSSVDTTSPVLKGFQNLSITQKQFLGSLVSSLIAIAGVVTAGAVIITTSGRSQLLQQAKSELAVNEINYDIKINQMGFGFRGQSDNAAVIAAATAYQNTQKIPPELFARIQNILHNEIESRQIEYATLVGSDRRILASGNTDRRGEIFDPNGLVTQVLKNPVQLKTSEIVPWAELAKEAPQLPSGTKPNKEALVRYTVTPVKAGDGKVLGALISGDVVVNSKLDIVANTVAAFDGGYSAVYQINSDGTFALANAFDSSQSKGNAGNDTTNTITRTSIDSPDLLNLADTSLLTKAVNTKWKTVVGRQSLDNTPYTLAAATILNAQKKPVAILVRGTAEDSFDALSRNSLLLQSVVGLAGMLVATSLAWLLGRAIAKPIKELQQTAEEFGEGNLQVRANVTSKDEVGRLAQTFNVMAEQIAIATGSLEDQSAKKQKEAEFQRQERERLQESVIRLLLQIEGARQGDLSIQAQVDEGEVGSIADAFNATLRSLRTLVAQVQSSANQVYDSAIANNELITNLSDEATLQERAIQSAERSVQGIAKSIQSVAKSAQVAAKIARNSRLVAQEGEKTMDETVDNIDTIRSSVADTSKKAKRLAESSQEISKIVSIIADISEKTNLLAFNASIEATRAGENGQGFRVVADEVRRLAEQVTNSAQEIEQLISGIQDETAQMMQMMEESTTQVVAGTELVRKTKTTLQNVARISTDIDKVLTSISAATVSQQNASDKVTKTMQSVAVVAQKTAAESQDMSSQLKELTQVAIALQESSARFKID